MVIVRIDAPRPPGLQRYTVTVEDVLEAKRVTGAFERPPVEVSAEERGKAVKEQQILLRQRYGLSAVDSSMTEMQLDYPRYRSPVTRVLVGRDGTVWLRHEYQTGFEPSWTILNRRAQPCAYARAPADVTLTQVTSKQAWGVSWHADSQLAVILRFKVSPIGDGQATADVCGAFP